MIQQFKAQDSCGKVLRISGTIIDVQFPADKTPPIYNAIYIQIPQPDADITKNAHLEVMQQLGDGVVRCIALEDVSHISRGLPVFDTGGPITVPVGKETLGRIFDVLGNTIDQQGTLENCQRWAIHREPPSLIEQNIHNEIQETGIKSNRFDLPLFKRFKNRFIWWSRSGQNYFSHGTDS
jgi:F-type H+-transporting ATPase subunit beta